jgi:hypothetical protein
MLLRVSVWSVRQIDVESRLNQLQDSVVFFWSDEFRLVSQINQADEHGLESPKLKLDFHCVPKLRESWLNLGVFALEHDFNRQFNASNDVGKYKVRCSLCWFGCCLFSLFFSSFLLWGFMTGGVLIFSLCFWI